MKQCKHLARWLAMASAVTILAGCDDDPAPRPTAATFASTVASEWFDLAYAVVRDERLPPTAAARVYGHTALALHEAVVPGSPRRLSLSGQIQGLGAMPAVSASLPYDWPSAANAAIAAVLRGLLPTASAKSAEAITALELRYQNERANVAQGGAPTVTRSLEFGQAVAAVVLARAGQDGLRTWNNCAYTIPTGAGLWERTPPANAAPLQPCWGRLTPMVLATGGTCAIPPPSSFSTSPGSPIYAQMHEVYSTLNNLRPEQRATALYWADNPGQSGTPSGHWIRIVGQYAREHQLGLDLAAEAYARVGIAVNDAFISCWNTKFTYNTMRPVTYIRRHIDASWPLPHVATPPFPDYPSGHSTQSGAVAEVLANLFGEVPFTDSTHVALGLGERSFPNWSAAADEAAISRLYGGIHYRDSIVLGVEQGRCIGREIVASVRFQN